MKRFASLLCLALVLTLTASAQPSLNFKRVLGWPTKELYFSVECSGNPVYTLAKQDFTILENGVEVTDFTLWCPDPTMRCAISVALVFDASSSMTGTSGSGARQAGHAFVDLMDGVVDEATIIFFNQAVTVFQQLTTIKPMLHTAVDALPASGGTAVWDGIYAGLIELVNNGLNQCRAVIVLADGRDNASTHTVAEVIALANRHRIHVFTICLGSDIDATELELIASLTGGRYYQVPAPAAGNLAAIYAEITTIIFQGFQECLITYERDCADHSLRTVELQLRDFCGGTDVKTKTYRADLDSSTFSNLWMKLGDVTIRSGMELKVPLELITPIDQSMFSPLTFTVQYDPQCMTLRGVDAPAGSLLDGLPFTVTPVPGGATIAMMDGRVLDGNGWLMELTFETTDPLDTVCCELRGIDARFERGCFIPIIEPAEICILPRETVITCDISAPKELVWQRGITEYTPSPFPVTMRISNIGDREATNVRAKISYHAADARLVSPLSDEQVGIPTNLPAGAFSDVTWQLAAERRTTADSAEFCITASFDNHENVICCVKVYIPPTDVILDCALDVPTIVADPVTGQYAPMPFPVTATVTNTGGMRTDTVFTTIVLPPELSLAPGEEGTRRLLPRLLIPGQQGQASWLLQHPPTTTEKQYVIRVWTKSSNADSVFCETTIVIPAISDTIVPRITANGPLSFCDGGEVILDAGDGYVAYRWSGGDSTRILTVRQSGTYSVTVRDALGRTGTSDPVTVTVFPLPPKPILTRSGDVLRTDSAAAWQWFRNGLPIPGATAQFLLLAESGTYVVSVTNSEGCAQVSDEFVVNVLGIETPAVPEWTISVYPEPSTGVVTLRGRSVIPISGSVILFDMAGRVVLDGIPIEGEGVFSKIVDLSRLQPGTYLLRITANGSRQDVKIRRL
ncbi:MAG: VWA domain-containing protein [Bacteroidota bacterium]|jgi:Mg-chelatase subunit ChlD|nr:VWA domain-containing protein [Bacteroidota bacterium]